MICRKCGGILSEEKLIFYFKNKFYIINKKNLIFKIKSSYSKYQNLMIKYHFYNNNNNVFFREKSWVLLLSKVDFTLPYFISDGKLVTQCKHCGTEFIIKEHLDLINKSKQDVKQNILERLNIIKTNKNGKNDIKW